MRVNLVIEPGNLFEVQLPQGDTLISGGPDVARLFRAFKPIGPTESIGGGWSQIPYDIDPYAATGALGTVLQREAADAARAGANKLAS